MGGMDRIDLAQKRDKWQAVGKAAMNLRVPQRAGNFLIYFLSTAMALTRGGNSKVHIYTQTIHRTTQITTEQHK